MSFFYIATPYSKYPYGLEAAFRGACRITGMLIAAKIPVYSPIAHSHSIAKYSHMDPLDHQIWLPADKPMMDAAYGLVVVMMDGWDKSIGIEHEIAAFAKAGKPIIYMEPGEIPLELEVWRDSR